MSKHTRFRNQDKPGKVWPTILFFASIILYFGGHVVYSFVREDSPWK